MILAVFRMLKNSLVHATSNKAVQITIKETHAIIGDFASIVGGYVSITYVDDTIFVCGQLLRASRIDLRVGDGGRQAARDVRRLRAQLHRPISPRRTC